MPSEPPTRGARSETLLDEVFVGRGTHDRPSNLQTPPARAVPNRLVRAFVLQPLSGSFLYPPSELLGEANWWFPGWLDRLLRRLQIEGARASNASQRLPELDDDQEQEHTRVR